MAVVVQVGFVASFVSKLSDTVSSEIGKVRMCEQIGMLTVACFQSIAAFTYRREACVCRLTAKQLISSPH